MWSGCKKVKLSCVLTTILPVHRTCCEPRNIGHQMTPPSPGHVASPQPKQRVRGERENRMSLELLRHQKPHKQTLAMLLPLLVHGTCSYEGRVSSSVSIQHKEVALGMEYAPIHQDPNSIKVLLLQVLFMFFVRAVHHLIAISRFSSHFTF